MAYTPSDFVKDMALYTAGAVIGPRRSAQFFAYAAKKGIQLTARAAPAVARTAAVTPAGRAATLAALGYGAYRGGLIDPYLDDPMLLSRQLDQPIAEPIPIPQPIIKARKKVKSKFNAAVSKGMKTVKASTSYGKKGVINNAKKAFTAVTKTVSAKKKGNKAPKKGIRRKIWNAIGKI